MQIVNMKIRGIPGVGITHKASISTSVVEQHKASPYEFIFRMVSCNKTQRAFHALYPVLVLSFERPKERTAIRALIHPWALGLAHIRVRSENALGISPVPLNYFSIIYILPKCFSHFRDFRNHSSHNLITRLFAALSIRVIYSISLIPVFSMIFIYSNRRLSAPVKLLLLHVQLHYLKYDHQLIACHFHTFHYL